jgi:anti-sigma regulatory factor (Ser/Thr protein kinase)
MPGVRKRGEAIRSYILDNLAEHTLDIVARTARRFDISRQAVNHHIRRLVGQNDIIVEGSRSRPKYRLVVQAAYEYEVALDKDVEEDVLWRKFVLSHVTNLPENVLAIWEYGVTEMINNAVDHSEGSVLTILVQEYRNRFDVWVIDNGVGIFKKIATAMELEDERHAVLELAKGKFTTDPDNHTGEGIFFSSRVFDHFSILSGDVFFAHQYEDPSDWIANTEQANSGTSVWMGLKSNCRRTVQSVFDKYAGPEEYAFTKTVVPVSLAEYGDETLVSRSQAKRLLTRVDRFSEVLFDFKNVKRIGQAFADEIFRVFAKKHPEIEITIINAGPKIRQMISRAQTHNEV